MQAGLHHPRMQTAWNGMCVGIVHEGMAFTLSYEKSLRLISWECDGMGVV